MKLKINQKLKLNSDNNWLFNENLEFSSKMENKSSNNFGFKAPKIGIIGGGQLGKMLSIEAKRLGMFVIVIDPTNECPASSVCDELITADFKDIDAIKKVSERCDILTYEIELANADFLEKLEQTGKIVHPSGKTLKIIQNKFRQKIFLLNNALPVPKFLRIDSFEDLLEKLKDFHGKAMLKISEGSYDGRGNFPLVNKTREQISEIYNSIKQFDIFIEEWVDFEKELSIMVARNERGEIKTFPVAENIHRDSILDISIVPARIPQMIHSKIKELATKVLDTLQGSGVFGIELFLTNSDEILINEIAPRVHNSGHYTIEACETNQFQQHIRAICNLPLGSTKLHKPAVMVNLLGRKSSEDSFYNNITDLLKVSGLSVHLYGKKEEKYKRKMGHFVIVDDSVEFALQKALELKEKFSI